MVNPIKRRLEARSGGGSVGSVLGGLGAILAAPFTGGASLAFMGPAMTAGGVVGGAVDKGSAGSSEPVMSTNPMAKRLAQKEPPTESAILKDSLKALHESQDEKLQSGYGESLFNAYNMAVKKERGGRVV